MDGRVLLGVGCQELIHNSLLIGDGVSHIIHVVIYFFEDVGGDSDGWPVWIGPHRGEVCASELVGASTVLDLPLKALMSFKKYLFPQQPHFIHGALLFSFLNIKGK